MGFLDGWLSYNPTKKEETINNYQYEYNYSYQTINNSNSFKFEPNSNASGIYVDGGRLNNSTAQAQKNTPTQQMNDKETDGSTTLIIVAAAAIGAMILFKK